MEVEEEARLEFEDEEVECLPADLKAKDPLLRAHITTTIEGQTFTGVVENIEVGKWSRERLYLIRYPDGDLEHFTEQQVLECSKCVVVTCSKVFHRGVPSFSCSLVSGHVLAVIPRASRNPVSLLRARLTTKFESGYVLRLVSDKGDLLQDDDDDDENDQANDDQADDDDDDDDDDQANKAVDVEMDECKPCATDVLDPLRPKTPADEAVSR
jgi:hypothetical protein